MSIKKITLTYNNIARDLITAYTYKGNGLALSTVTDKRGDTVAINIRTDISRFLTYPLSDLLYTISDGTFDYDQFYFIKPSPISVERLKIIVPKGTETVNKIIEMTFNDLFSISEYLSMFFGFVYGLSHPAFVCYPNTKYDAVMASAGNYMNCIKSSCNKALTDTTLVLDDRYIGTCPSARNVNTITITNSLNKLPRSLAINYQ